MSPCESSAEDLNADPDVWTEMRAVIDCVTRDLEPAAKALLDAASYRPGRTGTPVHDWSFLQDEAGDGALREVLRGLRNLRREE